MDLWDLRFQPVLFRAPFPPFQHILSMPLGPLDPCISYHTVCYSWGALLYSSQCLGFAVLVCWHHCPATELAAHSSFSFGAIAPGVVLILALATELSSSQSQYIVHFTIGPTLEVFKTYILKEKYSFGLGYILYSVNFFSWKWHARESLW